METKQMWLDVLDIYKNKQYKDRNFLKDVIRILPQVNGGAKFLKSISNMSLTSQMNRIVMSVFDIQWKYVPLLRTNLSDKANSNETPTGAKKLGKRKLMLLKSAEQSGVLLSVYGGYTNNISKTLLSEGDINQPLNLMTFEQLLGQEACWEYITYFNAFKNWISIDVPTPFIPYLPKATSICLKIGYSRYFRWGGRVSDSFYEQACTFLPLNESKENTLLKLKMLDSIIVTSQGYKNKKCAGTSITFYGGEIDEFEQGRVDGIMEYLLSNESVFNQVRILTDTWPHDWSKVEDENTPFANTIVYRPMLPHNKLIKNFLNVYCGYQHTEFQLLYNDALEFIDPTIFGEVKRTKSNQNKGAPPVHKLTVVATPSCVRQLLGDYSGVRRIVKQIGVFICDGQQLPNGNMRLTFTRN